MALSKEKVERIAQEYCSNGFNKTQGLLAVGYTKQYAESGLGHKVYGNIRVRDAIDAILSKEEAKSTYNKLKAEEEYTQAFDLAKSQGNVPAMVAATRGKAKLYGLEADLGQTTGGISLVVQERSVQAKTLDAKPTPEQAEKRFTELLQADKKVEGGYVVAGKSGHEFAERIKSETKRAKQGYAGLNKAKAEGAYTNTPPPSDGGN